MEAFLSSFGRSVDFTLSAFSKYLCESCGLFHGKGRCLVYKTESRGPSQRSRSGHSMP